MPGSASPSKQDPRYIHYNNEMARINNTQPTYRIGDITNPNIKQWAKDVMKKDNDEVLRRQDRLHAAAHLAGRPAFPPSGMGGGPVYLRPDAEDGLMMIDGDPHVRRVHMNVPHSANPKPSWYGESVGHYEGDTLVVDTIGLNTKTSSTITARRTPRSCTSSSAGG